MSNKYIFKNSIIGIIQFILTALLSFLSIPIFIHKLGIELYGIFALISVIGNLNFLTNFGLNGALLVYIANQGKCKDSHNDIAVTQILIIFLMIIFCTFSIFFRNFFLGNIFSIPTQYYTEAENLFIFLIFSNGILLIGQTYTAVFDALQKIYLTNIAQFIYSLFYWLGLIMIVYFDGSLTYIGLIIFIASLIWLIIVISMFLRVWGRIDYTGIKQAFKTTANKQIKYGSKIYLSGLSGFMFEPLSKILLSNFVGLNAVALFEIGIKVRTQINGIINKALYPIYPYIAKTPANDILHKKIFDLSKKIQLIVLPISMILMFTLTILLKLWLGPKNINQISTFVITMSVSLLLLAPQVQMIYQYLAAKNLAQKNIWIQVCSVVVNILFFFVFIKRLNIYTVLLSNTLAYISSYILCNIYQIKYFNINIKNELPFYFKLLFFGIVGTLICISLRLVLPVSIGDLLIFPILISILFISYIRLLKLVSEEDIDFYFQKIGFLNKSLKFLLI